MCVASTSVYAKREPPVPRENVVVSRLRHEKPLHNAHTTILKRETIHSRRSFAINPHVYHDVYTPLENPINQIENCIRKSCAGGRVGGGDI